MSPDEISGRDDHAPLASRRAVALLVLALAVGGLAGAAALMDDPAPEPVPAPSRSAPTPSGTTGSAAGTALAVDALCPVETDGRTRLTVRFLLLNRSDSPVRVLRVEPVLPRGRLQPAGTSVVPGDCHRWSPGGGPDDRIPPGGTRMVLLRFRLPEGCPGPVLVQARVAARTADGTTTSDVLSLTDLRSVGLDVCPQP